MPPKNTDPNPHVELQALTCVQAGSRLGRVLVPQERIDPALQSDGGHNETTTACWNALTPFTELKPQSTDPNPHREL